MTKYVCTDVKTGDIYPYIEVNFVPVLQLLPLGVKLNTGAGPLWALQVEKELTKTEGLLEAALRERGAVDNKLGKVHSELEAANKKVAIQERVLARGEAKYQVTIF
jgi:hypothetical protein